MGEELPQTRTKRRKEFHSVKQEGYRTQSERKKGGTSAECLKKSLHVSKERNHKIFLRVGNGSISLFAR